MPMRTAEDWAREHDCGCYRGAPCDSDWCACHRDVLLIRAVQADALRAAAAVATKRVVGGYMHGAAEWPDGEDIAAAILALIPKEKQT